MLQWIAGGALLGWMAAHSFYYEYRAYGLEMSPYNVMVAGLLGGAFVAWIFWRRVKRRVTRKLVQRTVHRS